MLPTRLNYDSSIALLLRVIDRTRVACISRQILSFCASKEAPWCFSFGIWKMRKNLIRLTSKAILRTCLHDRCKSTLNVKVQYILKVSGIMCTCHFLLILYHFPLFCICQNTYCPLRWSHFFIHHRLPPLECKHHRARILAFLFTVVTSVPWTVSGIKYEPNNVRWKNKWNLVFYGAIELLMHFLNPNVFGLGDLLFNVFNII